MRHELVVRARLVGPRDRVSPAVNLCCIATARQDHELARTSRFLGASGSYVDQLVLDFSASPGSPFGASSQQGKKHQRKSHPRGWSGLV